MGLSINTDFDILDESNDFIVVAKPAPLQIHPSAPNGPPTLWHGLQALLAYEMANGGQVSIINRLDRETSGVVLVAKSAAAARRFGIAMQERQIHKTYLAIVHGWPDWEEFDLDAPLRRQGEVRPSRIWVKQTVHPDGAPCRTRFRTCQRLEYREQNGTQTHRFALVEARPITGRMHQIRVHLAHLGHPILGDKIYGADESCYLDFIETGWTPDLERRLLFHRQALHSHRLDIAADFQHGWQAPLPNDMQAWLESCCRR